MGKRGKISLLLFMIFLLVAINYNYIDSYVTKEFESGFSSGNREAVLVTRIVDGDTIELSDKIHVRLLGINTPEKGETYSNEAKALTSSAVLNKTVYLEYGKDKIDLYNRTLAYVFLENGNNAKSASVNEQLISNGFANPYFPTGEDKYEVPFREAWNSCISKNINFCEKSKDKCASCVILKNLDMKNEIALFYNKCGYDCSLNGWNIKDEGRKVFTINSFTLKSEKEVSIIVTKTEKANTENKIYWKRGDYVWTQGGDTLFLRDSKGKLILFYNY